MAAHRHFHELGEDEINEMVEEVGYGMSDATRSVLPLALRAFALPLLSPALSMPFHR